MKQAIYRDMSRRLFLVISCLRCRRAAFLLETRSNIISGSEDKKNSHSIGKPKSFREIGTTLPREWYW